MNSNADNHSVNVKKKPVTNMENPRRQNLEAYDASFTTHITFDYPAVQVWPYILNFKAWMTDYHFQMIAGQEHNEGAIIKANPKSCSDKTPKPHHKFVKIVRIEPNQVLVLKVFSAEGGSLGDKGYVVFDTFNLVEHDGKTTVVINCSGEFPEKAALNEEQQQAMNITIEKVMGDMFYRYEVILKMLVAKCKNSAMPRMV